MEHRMNLMARYFELIKSGEKIYEGRLAKPDKLQIEIGEKVVFYREPERQESFVTVVEDKMVFRDFEEMAKTLDKRDLGFADKTKQEIIDTYRTIYTHEDEQKYGVVVFKVKVI